MPILKPKT